LELEAAIPTESKKAKKRQAQSDPDVTTDEVDLGKNRNISSCYSA